jgi:hypothetical protein
MELTAHSCKLTGKTESKEYEIGVKGDLARTASARGRLHGLGSWRGRRKPQNKSKDEESKAGA